MLRTIAGLASALMLSSLSACSSDDSAASDAGSTGSDASQEEAQLNEAEAGESGPCDPLGTWLVSYEAPSGDPLCLSPYTDTVIIAKGDSGGLVADWGGPPSGTCSNPPTTYETFASLAADTCTLTTYKHAQWCAAMESRFDNRDLVLQLTGDSATGSLHFEENCGGQGTGTHDVPATAERQAPGR